MWQHILSFITVFNFFSLDMLKPYSSFFKIFCVIFLATLFFVIGCTKKDDLIDPDYKTSNIDVLFTDTITVKTTTVLDDSIRRNNVVTSLLGVYHDPLFGVASAAFYIEALIKDAKVDFGDSLTLDSLVLKLQYVDGYGKNDLPITVNVHRLTERISGSSIFSNKETAFSADVIGSKTLIPNLTDSVLEGFENKNVPAHLRIKLDDALGADILSKSGGAELTDTASFLDYLKGFYITLNEDALTTSLPKGEGGILYLSTNTEEITGLTLYYNDTMKYDFSIAIGRNYTVYEHDYQNTPIEQQILDPSTTDSVSYVHGMSGVRTKISFPTLKELNKDDVVTVHKAELSVPLAALSITNPDSILPALDLVMEEDGVLQRIPDFQNDVTEGQINDENEYTFLLTRYVNLMLLRKNYTHETNLYLIARGSAVRGNGSVINTQSHSTNPLRLNITYSKQ